MKIALNIVREEWRYWMRSKLAVSVLFISVILSCASVVVTVFNIQTATHERTHLQEKAHDTFLSQPDRHPHRMVHYGHYLFRTPSPLAALDPGVDAYTGTSIFLEGHRQNSAMFSQQQQSAGLTRFVSLTPAFVIQAFAPLLLILIGYSVMTREKESRTLDNLLVQGLNPLTLLTAKVIALFLAGVLVLLPLMLGSLLTFFWGESLSMILSFWLAYLLYIGIWCLLIALVSCFVKQGNTSFGLSIGLWITLCILLPRISSSTAGAMVEAQGKLLSDFAVIQQMRKLGDGHNAADPAFEQLKKNVLAQYDADNIEELPINFRGVVAKHSEAQLTDVLNKFAEERMQSEVNQATVARLFGWLSPVVAIRTVSHTLAGSGLETHHRFLREAEKTRFNFVQSLNDVHAEKLTYSDDVNRNSSEEAGRRARVSSDNWQVLQDFSFSPDAPAQRFNKSIASFVQLMGWFLALFLTCLSAGRKLI
jgi:ABC-2 type transport system permease protein